MQELKKILEEMEQYRRRAVENGDFNVAAAHETIKEDYLGILGTNNAFAVAFTEPRIKIVPSQTEFADVVKVYINYGIALVNPEDLIQIPALTTETP